MPRRTQSPNVVRHFMTDSLTILFFLAGTFCLTNSYGQEDTNRIIEKSKGTWTIPVSKYRQIQDIEYRKRNYSFNKTDSSITFVSDSSFEVRAAYNGKVISLSEQDGEWTLTTRFGDYFISYIGIAKPIPKIGDKIAMGQLLGLVTKDKNEIEYHLDILLNKLDKSIDPKPWWK
jgi:hypothetical protein